MSRNFATPQFIPQSPLRRINRRDATTYDDDQINTHDDEVSFRPVTPQRRQLSVTRSTPGSLFKSPRAMNTPLLNTPHGKGRGFDTSMIAGHVDKGANRTINNNTNGQPQNDNIVHYTTTTELTQRDLYFRKVAELEAEWAKAPQGQ